MNKCDYCQNPKRILINRNGFRFTVDGEEREINTFGREPKMCLDCLTTDLLSEIDFEECDA